MAMIAALTLWGCAPGAPALPDYRGDPARRGSVAKVEAIGAYSPLQMRLLLWMAKLQAPVVTGVRLYRVSYWSVTDGHPVLVSGLLGVPGRNPVRGAVLWMHATHVSREDSMSNTKGAESLPVSYVFAGGDYLLLAPDLVGLGVSRAPQAYLVNASTIDVSRDFVHAAQTVTHDLGVSWNPDFYLTGFSQGGHSAAILQEDFEAHPDPAVRLCAVAPIGGVYDLAGAAFPYALQGRSDTSYIDLANMALSYATYYHQPLESVLTQRNAAVAEVVLDGNHDIAALKQLPSNPRALFNDRFMANYQHGGTDWLIEAMRANSAVARASRTPLRLYYGDKDLDAPPADAVAFAASLRAAGADAQAISVGPYDHGGSAFQAAPKVRSWFDLLSAAERQRPRSGC